MMELFYQANIIPDTHTFLMDREESHHMIRVLRKSPGDLFLLTDGKGNLYEASFQEQQGSQALIHITSVQKIPPRPYSLHIAIAPTKTLDRFEWFLEKATELGVDSITPLLCEKSERRIVKHERLQKVLVAAIKQSQQAHLPLLNKITPFKEYLSKNLKGQLLIGHCHSSQLAGIKSLLHLKQEYHILIGPEGDFSPEEVQWADAKGWQAVSLGRERLRTETAGVYVTALAKILHG